MNHKGRPFEAAEPALSVLAGVVGLVASVAATAALLVLLAAPLSVFLPWQLLPWRLRVCGRKAESESSCMPSWRGDVRPPRPGNEAAEHNVPSSSSSVEARAGKEWKSKAIANMNWYQQHST